MKKFAIITFFWLLIFAVSLVVGIRVGFFIRPNAEVYAVCGDESIRLSDEDAEQVVYILRMKYDTAISGKCPRDYDVGFDIDGKRYAIALDGCNSVGVYNADREYIGGGCAFFEGYSINPYYFKYFDNEDIGECLSSDN